MIPEVPSNPNQPVLLYLPGAELAPARCAGDSGSTGGVLGERLGGRTRASRRRKSRKEEKRRRVNKRALCRTRIKSAKSGNWPWLPAAQPALHSSMSRGRWCLCAVVGKHQLEEQGVAVVSLYFEVPGSLCA